MSTQDMDVGGLPCPSVLRSNTRGGCRQQRGALREGKSEGCRRPGRALAYRFAIR